MRTARPLARPFPDTPSPPPCTLYTRLTLFHSCSTPGAVVYKVNNVIITQTSDQQQFRVLPEKVHRVAVSLDGKFMATCSVTEVKVYDNRQSDVRRPPVGTYKLEIPPKELNVVQLSPVDLQFSVDTSMLCIVCYDRQRRLGVTVFDMKVRRANAGEPRPHPARAFPSSISLLFLPSS